MRTISVARSRALAVTRITAPIVIILAAVIAACVFVTPRALSEDGAQPAFRPSRIVTIGDSIMAGLNLDPSEAWPAVLGDENDATVTNLGCSGAGFIAGGTCGTDFRGLIAKAVAARPQLVIVQSSDNDLGQSPAQLTAATRDTLVELRRALPNVRIVGFNTLWDQPGTEPTEVAYSSQALSAALRTVHGTYIDIGQPLRANPNLMQADSEHPTAAGQRVLAAAIVAALQRANIGL